MQKFVRLSLVIMALLVPIVAFAAPPNVTNIRTLNEGGKVRVTWNQVSGDISAYNIYYSHQSILENGGSYDDFETADGSTNTYLLQATPTSSDVYVSILAVDDAGVESPYFVEESKLTLSASSSASSVSSVASSSSSVANVSATDISLLSVESLSATGVLLTFNTRVVIPDDQAAQAINIKDASGSVLGLTRLIIQGNTVEVHTTTQERGRAYLVRLTDIVTGLTSNGGILPLAADQQPILFLGHATGTQPTTGGIVDNSDEVSSLHIQADAKGTSYNVTVTWVPAAQANVLGYDIAQSTDGGRTYSAPRALNAETTTVNIPNVPPSDFGVRVRVQYGAGQYSDGVTHTLRLPAISSTPVQGNTTTTPQTGKGSGSLTNSGPALWLAIISLLSAGGTWAIRSKRQMRV